MNKYSELPLIEPIYSTYHTGILSACIVDNPSIKNWYLNENMILMCERKFLSGYSTPKINITYSRREQYPYIEKIYINTRFLNGCINRVIRNAIDEGYYVMFSGVDDYYVKGKSWYKERHFTHDGTICGYNQIDKTYCIYAYDSNWIYRKFWTPQKCFEAGRKSCCDMGYYGIFCCIKPEHENVEFCLETVYENLMKYLDSNLEKYTENEEGPVYGLIVQYYISKYIDKLYDGSIPYEKMDRRVFRLIWEHKRLMLERIERVEEVLRIEKNFSKQYVQLVAEADRMRMLYASYHMKRRDNLLPIIKGKLLKAMNLEGEILTALTGQMRLVIEK